MIFGNVLTAMVTPYAVNGEVDYKKAQKLAEYLLKNGSDGLVVAGTTGEAPVLSSEEKLRLFAAVKEQVAGKGVLIANTGSYNTRESIELTKKAEALGVDGVLAVVPYYNKPPQEGLYQHFSAIAASTCLPVIPYNIPGRSIINMEPKTVARLADACPNIRAIKESSANLEQIARLRASLPPDFLIYSGDDYMTLPILQAGGVGVISVAAHFVGPEIQEMITKFKNDDISGAKDLHDRLMPAFKNIFATTNPILVKCCMNLLGWQMGDCRLPLVLPTKEQVAMMQKLLLDMGCLPA